MQNDIHTPQPFSWTGSKNINILDPDPDDFVVEEIVRSLSRRPRYGGFSDEVVSIAAHTLICDAIFRDIMYEEHGPAWRSYPYIGQEWRRGIVIHDWSEAYLSDIQRPLKRTEGFDYYRELEALYERRMQEKWNAEVPHDLLKLVDNLALAAEVHVAMPAVLGQWTSLPEPTGVGLAMARELCTSPMVTPRAVEHRLLRITEELGIR